MPVKIKRIYEKPQTADGFRILIDRLWPRGIRKEDARILLWLKELAPSSQLRKWFAHDPQKWPEFQKRYKAELKKNPNGLSELKKLYKKEKNITLVYAAKNEEHNNAVVLKSILEKK